MVVDDFTGADRGVHAARELLPIPRRVLRFAEPARRLVAPFLVGGEEADVGRRARRERARAVVQLEDSGRAARH